MGWAPGWAGHHSGSPPHPELKTWVTLRGVAGVREAEEGHMVSLPVFSSCPEQRKVAREEGPISRGGGGRGHAWSSL